MALRLVATHDEMTRRVDFLARAGESVAVEVGSTTPFTTDRLWPEVRDRLPDLALLWSDPRGRVAPPPREPGPGFESCRADVALATVVTAGEELAPESDPTEAGVVAVRTWLVADEELWEAMPRADGTTDVRPASPGALADLLILDVTGAFEALVSRVGQQQDRSHEQGQHQSGSQGGDSAPRSPAGRTRRPRSPSATRSTQG